MLAGTLQTRAKPPAPVVQQHKRQRRLAEVTSGSCARQPARVVEPQELQGKGYSRDGCRLQPILS